MAGFSVPISQTDNKAAFVDSDSAAVWLAGQPQANAPAMLASLVAQIQLFNSSITTSRERFKTLEVLRKSIFSVSQECQRRYENKPLPLLPAEQTVLDMTRRLWRSCTVGYLHCLRACLEKDALIMAYSAKVAHRVLACLRMEQMSCYLAGAELDGEFWRNLHSIWASAEQLSVTRDPVEDRLLGETSKSTVSGQYGMVLMLHLARPFTLSRGQFAAATRWLARWREQAAVIDAPDANPKSCCVALNLSQDRPIHDHSRAASVGRWLSVDAVLRKMQQRLELLAKGESPELLKLGSGLTSEACVALLTMLTHNFRYPQNCSTELVAEMVSVNVAAGLENIHRLLGGKGLTEAVTSASHNSRLNHEQIAVFGHFVRDGEAEAENGKFETWQFTHQAPGVLNLFCPTGSVESRLILGGLLAVKLPQHQHCTLAMIGSLFSRIDGGLCVTASLFDGQPKPLIAEARVKPAGKNSRQPAFLLPAGEGGSRAVIVLPAGLPARAVSIRFLDASDQSPMALRLVENLGRGGDIEHWSVAIDS
ncbi:hypothetical protein [Propionivibrio sp.]|uniref:hypothetical protein n=1 Tax=Propionivibrio sp. TaxID=2212460 RepID=UPI00261E4DE8|nr:hypothetical protein [Propionivibrio sp.]